MQARSDLSPAKPADDDGGYSTDTEAGALRRTHRRTLAGVVVVALAAALLCLAAVPATAAGVPQTNAGPADTQSSTDVPASEVVDYAVVPEDAEGEAGDRVAVDIEAIDFTEDGDGDVTAYDLTVDYDDEILVFDSAESFLAEDEDLDVEQDNGTVSVEWNPNAFENAYDELIAEVADGEASPDMNVTLVTLEFASLSDYAGETAEIDVTDDSQMWHGTTELESYDDDNVWWGNGAVDVVEELEDDGPSGPDGPQVGEFTAVSQGGFVAFNEETEADAREEGVDFPAQSDDETPIQIHGEIFDDGTWQSTDVSFPTLEASGMDVDVYVDEKLYGDIDEDADHMTAEGEFRVVIDNDEDTSFEFEIASLTDDSNALSGSGDLADDGGAVTVVDNEFLVEDTTGDSTVDSGLGLPSTEEGENWIELPLDIEITDTDVPTGSVEGTVESEAGDPIADADVNVVDELDATQTDEDGSYAFDLPVGTYDLAVDADGYYETTVEVEIEEDETTERDIALEAGDPALEAILVGDEVTAGETAEIVATIENVGDGAGTQDVVLSVGDDSMTESVTLDVEEETSVFFDWETSTDDAGEYTAEIETEDDTASAEVVVEADDDEAEDAEGADTVSVTSQGGFISFSEPDDVETAREEGLELPAEGDDDGAIEVEGTYNGDTWSSTSVDFPDLDADGITAEVSVPDGLEGELDPESDYMTVEGTLTVTIPDAGSFSFDVELTTDGSGALDGSGDLDADGGSVTVVDNEYLVSDESGDDTIDTVLDLPATSPGENWLELELSVDIEEGEEPEEADAEDEDEADKEDEPEQSATEASDDDESTGDESAAEPAEVEVDGDSFVAHSQGGFISFAEDGEDQAIEEGLAFPVQGDDDSHIRIVGTIDDGTWESEQTVFPTLVTDSGVEAEVSAPDGLSGEIDKETGEMTATGELEVAVGGDPDTTFSFEIDTTTGDSGALSGDGSFSDDSGSATLVDNEFLVDDTTGDTIIDSQLELPVTESGTNWFELELDVEFDADGSESGDAGDESEETGAAEETQQDYGGSLVTSFGQLTGFLGMVAAGGLVTFSLASRVAVFAGV